MTPQELELAVRQRYNAVGDSFFPSTMIYNLIYQASMEMAVETKCIEETYTTTSVSSQREYSYPTNAISIRRVEYKGVKVRPARIERDPKTSTTQPTGTPTLYAVWNKEIIFYPTPDTSSEQIKLFTYNMPAEVTSSSVLDIPSEYHLDMIDFILSAFFAKDKDRAMATYHRELWLSNLKRIKKDRAKRLRGDEFAVVAMESDMLEQPVIYL